MVIIFIIAIDSGTTNSRISLINKENKTLLAYKKMNIGVRNTIPYKGNEILRDTITDAIQGILREENISLKEIEYVVASGMITSNLGIVEVPHIKTPVNKQNLSDAVHQMELEEFPGLPWYFIPGLKTSLNYKGQELKYYDVIRGEESETFGLLDVINVTGNGLIILPGSHNKIIFVKDNSITNFYTTLSGELLYAIKKDTILSSSLKGLLIETINYEYLLKGLKDALEFGVTKTLFHIRLMDLFKDTTENDLANYMTGAIIASDLETLKYTRSREVDWILIGGSDPLREAYYYIFNVLYAGTVIHKASEKDVTMSTFLGASSIVEKLRNN